MKNKILKNWKSGLTVSLISIPLALALAISSGATPTQGIITAFWAGLISAIFGGSNYNIVGPTGALAGVLISYTVVYGFQMLPFVAVASGLFMLVAYAFHLDRYIIFIPRSVMHGFTLGVAIIIGLGQLDNIFGFSGVPKTESFFTNTVISLKNIPHAHWDIFAIFLVSTVGILFWNKKFPKIPGSAVVAFLSIITVSILSKLGFSSSIMTIGDKYPSIHATIFENSIFGTFDKSIFLNREFWIISFTTAIIAILETLLSGQIADSITKTKFDRSKEVLGLSLANIGSGLMGGIPATAALARTALNIRSGATHKISAIFNSLFMGIIAVFLLQYFERLPMVIVASILFVVAIGMVEKKHFIHLIENEGVAFTVSIIVALFVVVEDPITGILVGSVVALFIFVNKVSYGQTEILLWKNGKMTEALLKDDFLKKNGVDSDIVVYKISGALTYINMPAHLDAAQKIKNNKYVIISLRHSFHADIDGIDHLGEIIEILKTNKNEKVLLAGINREVERRIHKEDFYKRKLLENKIYSRTSEAIRSITNEK